MILTEGTTTMPTPEQVVDFLGASTYRDGLGLSERDRLHALAIQHLPFVTATVRAYTRGRGFDLDGQPTPDLALVIVASCARLTQNPQGIYEDSDSIDDASSSKKLSIFNGWTLPELAILHRYRKRAL